MKNEDKKLLLNILGYRMLRYHNGTYNQEKHYQYIVAFNKDINGLDVIEYNNLNGFQIIKDYVYLDSDDWDPENKYEQFAEIWNRLTITQRYNVIDNSLRMNRDGILFINLFMNNLPKVMQSVLDVLRNE